MILARAGVGCSLGLARKRLSGCGVRAMSSKWPVAERVRNSTPSIWVEFTTLAAQCKAVNIGQGFPDSPVPSFVCDLLKEIASHPERTDFHQYTRGFGHPRLVAVLADIYSKLLAHPIDPNTDIVVTVGAYLALYYAFMGWLSAGDEAIVLEPAYDCYLPQITLTGARPVPVLMHLAPNATSSADYHLRISDLEAAITPRTKLLVLNNPHNPTGKLFSREELMAIAEVVRRHDLIVIADEVYEWHVYPGHEMVRFASLPGMFPRTITIGSAGKAFSVTGWKLGWAMGPSDLLAPLRSVHQNCVFTCSTPTQEAVARAFERERALLDASPEKSYLRTGLASELIGKRDRLARSLRSAGFRPLIPEAGYFMIADFAAIAAPFRDSSNSDALDFQFVRWLCRDRKLATIPPSAFYSPQFKKEHDHFVRVCFFKTDETLAAAEAIISKLAANPNSKEQRVSG